MAVGALALPETTQTDGVQTLFAIPFVPQADGEVVVTYEDNLGIITTLELSTDYVVQSGSVELAGRYGAPVADGYLTVSRDVPATQEINFKDRVRFPQQQTEQALDKLTRLVQDLEVKLRTTIQLPIREVGQGVQTFGSKTVRAGYVPNFDDDGNIEYIIRREQLLDILDNIAAIQVVAGSIQGVDALSGVIAEMLALAPLSTEIASLGSASAAISELNVIRPELLAIHAFLNEINVVGDDLLDPNGGISPVAEDLLRGSNDSAILTSLTNAETALNAAEAAREQAIVIGEPTLQTRELWTDDVEGHPLSQGNSTATFILNDAEGPHARIGGGGQASLIKPKAYTRILPGRLYELQADIDLEVQGSQDPATVRFVIELYNRNYVRFAELQTTDRLLTVGDPRLLANDRASSEGYAPAAPVVLVGSEVIFAKPVAIANPVTGSAVARVFRLALQDVSNTAAAEEAAQTVLADIQAQINGLSYVPPTVSISLSQTVAEVGVSVASLTVNYTCSVTDGHYPATLTVDGQDVLIADADGLSGSVVLNNGGAGFTVNKTVSASILDTASGEAGGVTPGTDNATLSFRHRAYWVVEDGDNISGLDAAGIQAWDDAGSSPYDTGEGGSALDADAYRTITTAAGAAGRYLKYGYADSLADPRVEFDSNGFATAIDPADQATVTIGGVQYRIVRVLLPTNQTIVEFRS